MIKFLFKLAENGKSGPGGIPFCRGDSDIHPIQTEGPATDSHVIARRAKPDVAISCYKEPLENRRDCHGPDGPRNDVLFERLRFGINTAAKRTR